MDDNSTETISPFDASIICAIAVLRAYANGTLETDMCDELDDALTKAYYVWEKNLPDDSDYETPLTSSW